MTASSPCVNICVMNGAFCMGCGRTLDEIARWGTMPEAQRRAIMTTLPARLASHADADRARQADTPSRSRGER